MSDTALPTPRSTLRAAQLKEFRGFVRRFARNPLGMFGLAIVLLLLFCAAFAPWLATHDPYLPTLTARLSAPNVGTQQMWPAPRDMTDGTGG